MRRGIAAGGSILAAALVGTIAMGWSARAATPQPAAAQAALQYLYSQQLADGSIEAIPGQGGSAGVTEDTIIGIADNGYDPATLVSSGGVSALTYLAGQVSGGKVTTPGGVAKLILAWVAAGKPASIDGAALITKLNTPAASGGLLQANGSWLTARGFGNGFTQAMGVLADVAAGHALPANATGWLLCAQLTDGGFIDEIDPTGSAPPASCSTSSGDTSDTNDTGIAVQALDAARVTSADAAAQKYLASAQQTDGGFGYDGFGPTDPDSDAVVILGLLAMHQDPTGAAWTKSGSNAMTTMLALQSPAGSGAYFYPGQAPNGFTTSDGVVEALALKPYASATTFTVGKSPVAAPAATPTPTPTPSPTATPTPTPSPSPAATATPTAAAGALVSTPSTGGGGLGQGAPAGAAVTTVVLLGIATAGGAARWRTARRR
jgi:hypothetical protein